MTSSGSLPHPAACASFTESSESIDGEKLRRLFRLVRLQMADQMEARAVEIGDSGRFALHLLHVVFAEFAQPERLSLADRFRSEYLGDRQQLHRRRSRGRARAQARSIRSLTSVQPIGKGISQARSSIVTKTTIRDQAVRRLKLFLATAAIPKDTDISRLVPHELNS